MLSFEADINHTEKLDSQLEDAKERLGTVKLTYHYFMNLSPFQLRSMKLIGTYVYVPL